MLESVTAMIVCEPGIGVWCCNELVEQICDGGESCECVLGEEVCGRPYMLVGMIVNDSDDQVLDRCPYCSAKIVQKDCSAKIVTQSIQKGGDR